LETEYALYQTLHQLRGSSHEASLSVNTSLALKMFGDTVSQRSKASRIEEWERFPLLSSQNLVQWLSYKSAENHHTTTQSENDTACQSHIARPQFEDLQHVGQLQRAGQDADPPDTNNAEIRFTREVALEERSNKPEGGFLAGDKFETLQEQISGERGRDISADFGNSVSMSQSTWPPLSEQSTLSTSFTPTKSRPFYESVSAQDGSGKAAALCSSKPSIYY
jgi:hypothetical protein